MNTVQYPTATPESIWAILQETNEILTRTSKLQEENQIAIKELQKSQSIISENIANLQKSQSITSTDIVNFQKSQSITSTQIDNLHKTVGGWGNSFGSFAEEYFFNSFERGEQNFFGKKFDEIGRNLKLFWQGLTDEYDIVLYNNDAVAIIEVKFKAAENDIPQVLKKAETFKILSPNYKDCKIYLGLASMTFSPALEDKCIESGIAIIKQVGDSVVINDKHLKVF